MSTAATVSNNNNKKPSREAILQTIDEKIVQLTDVFKDLLHKTEERIVNEVNSKFQQMQEELNRLKARVDKFERHSESLQAELLNVKQHMERKLNAEIANDVSLNGVPYEEGENLNTIFSNLCDTLEIPTPSIREVYRINNKSNNNNLSDTIINNNNNLRDTIIIKCTKPVDKGGLLKAISHFRKTKKRPLNLSDLGYTSQEPIFLNECLTKHNYKILQAAIQLRKKSKLKAAYSFRGNIYVKKLNTDNGILIENMEQLNSSFR